MALLRAPSPVASLQSRIRVDAGRRGRHRSWLRCVERSSCSRSQRRRPRGSCRCVRRVRYETKNWALHAMTDENQITLHTMLNVYLMRPWKVFVQGPILACLRVYMSYLHGVLYHLFEAVCALKRISPEASANMPPVPHLLPRSPRLELRRLRATICISHLRHTPRVRTHDLLHRDELQTGIHQGWEIHTRRTAAAEDSFVPSSCRWRIFGLLVGMPLGSVSLRRYTLLLCSTIRDF